LPRIRVNFWHENCSERCMLQAGFRLALGILRR
jgi:hypothetical protein